MAAHGAQQPSCSCSCSSQGGQEPSTKKSCGGAHNSSSKPHPRAAERSPQGVWVVHAVGIADSMMLLCVHGRDPHGALRCAEA